MEPMSESSDKLLREVAYDRLQDAIKHAQLEPGAPLSETRISKALGISRTPVREALQKLAKDGLVHIIPGRAITVAAPSMQEVLDAMHVRELLEPELARLAAEGLPLAARETLKKALQDMEQAAAVGDRLAWSKADTSWHEILSEFCPNRLLGQFVLEARNRMHHKTVAEYTSDQYLKHGTDEHKQVVEAIIAYDAEKAEQLMRDHVKHVRENVFKRLIRY